MSRLLFALAAGVPALAGWIRLESPHFELYTDADARRGHSILERLELVRHAFAGAAGSPVLSPVPVRVFLLASPGAFRPLRASESTVGFFQSGPERNYIVLHWAGEQTERVAAHEYVHLLLNHTTVALPRWLEEGTAEFYSTLRAEGDNLAVGAPIFAHLQTLRGTPWLDASTLTAVTRDSPFYKQPDKAALFYAQSWALVHMLHLSEGYRGTMPRFVELLEGGVPAAFLEAFGKPLETALQDLERYVAAGRFISIRVPLEPLGNRQITGPRPVPDEESLLIRAELLLDMGKEVEAAQLYRRLAAGNPGSPPVHTALGALALRRGDYAAARRHLGRAIELGEPGARTHFDPLFRRRVTEVQKRAFLQKLPVLVVDDGRKSACQAFLETGLEHVIVQGHDVAYPGHELGVGMELEAFHAVGLQAVSLPHAVHGHVADPAALGQRARAPVSGIWRPLLQGHAQDVGHSGLAQLLVPARSGRVTEQALHPGLVESVSATATRWGVWRLAS